MKNIELKPKENTAVISVNPKVFALEVIYAASYVLLDRAYFILDGNPEEEIKVLMRPKKKLKKNELEELALKFQDELINYSVYVVQAARNQAVREAIIKRAFATNMGAGTGGASTGKGEPRIDDPKGIAEPWTPEKAEGLENPAESEKKKSK